MGLRCFIGSLHLDTSKPNRMGLIQYSSDATVQCDITSSALVLVNALDSMHQLKAGTNTLKGLEKCKTLFTASAPRDGNMRWIIHFSDGEFESLAKVKALANELNFKDQMKIVSIGVGAKVNKDSLRATAFSPTFALFMKDFDEVLSVLSPQTQVSTHPPIVQPTIRTLNSLRVQMSRDHFASFEIELYKDNKWGIVGECEGMEFEITGLRSGTAYKVRVRAVLTNSQKTTYSDVLEIKTLKEHPFTRSLRDPELPEINKNLLNSLISRKPCSEAQQLGILRYNILIAGRRGNGKSSLFNSMYSIILGYYQALGVTRESRDTVTKEIFGYPIFEGATLIDMFGWKEDNNFDDMLKSVLEGKIGPGFVEGNHASNSSLGFKESPTKADKIHAVILVSDCKSILNNEEMDRMKHYYPLFQDNHIQCNIAIPKLDLKDERIQNDTAMILESHIAENFLNQFIQQSSISANIFPIVNYREPWTNRDHAREFLILSLFESAFNQADALAKRLFISKGPVQTNSPASPPTSTPLQQNVTSVGSASPSRVPTLKVRGSMDSKFHQILVEPLKRQPSIEILYSQVASKFNRRPEDIESLTILDADGSSDVLVSDDSDVKTLLDTFTDKLVVEFR